MDRVGKFMVGFFSLMIILNWGITQNDYSNMLKVNLDQLDYINENPSIKKELPDIRFNTEQKIMNARMYMGINFAMTFVYLFFGFGFYRALKEIDKR